MKKRWVLTIIVIAAVSVSPLESTIFGASLEELIGSERAAALRAAVELTEVQTRNPTPRLLPRHSGLESFVTGLQDTLGPNILVENLSLYRKPTPPESAAGWSSDEQTGLLNQLVALSTLTGIQYYSASRKTMRTFYESSVTIDNPTDKKPLPDPVYSVLPASIVLHARQKDLTFGDNIYRYDYYTGADSIFFTQENLTPMSTGIITAVSRNRFRMVTAIIDSGDSLLIYAAAMAKATSLPGMGDRIGVSFTNRAKAILKWFAGQADTVF